MLPHLIETALFASKKSDELVAYYFQQTHGEEDSQEMRKLSLEYVHRTIEIMHVAAKMKPFRTVEHQ